MLVHQRVYTPIFSDTPNYKVIICCETWEPHVQTETLGCTFCVIGFKAVFFLKKTPYSFYIPILHTMNCHMSYVQCAGGWSFPMNKGLQIIRTPQMTLG